MPPARFASSSKPPLGRHLVFAEREEIALLRAQGHGVRAIARRLARAASTISRELRRNAATRSGGLEYRATTAQWHAERSARRPKAGKLAINAALRSTGDGPGHGVQQPSRDVATADPPLEQTIQLLQGAPLMSASLVIVQPHERSSRLVTSPSPRSGCGFRTGSLEVR